MAFLHGTQYVPGQSIDQWAEASGLNWKASALDGAGCVAGGRIVWASAKFNGPLEVAGDKPSPRHASTSYPQPKS